MLEEQKTSRSYRELFNAKFPFTPLTDEQRQSLDSDSLSFIDLAGPRVPDGRKLYAKLNSALRAAPPATEPCAERRDS
jgi:hypothetical protein